MDESHPHHHDDHDDHDDHEHGHDHAREGGPFGWFSQLFAHSHAPHERVDSALESSEKGIRALKISLGVLGLTALLQVGIVWLSGSVALLADTIHNFGDAATSIPLWIAFNLSKRARNRRYTYGYDRAEDLAGVLIVLLILFSACVAAYESVMRLLHPQPVTHLWWVVAAGVIGFIGNEAVAMYRMRVGREIGSAALVADGQHSRVDGFTSLAVIGGAVGTALGYPLVDPLIGIGITVAILFIVKDVGRSIWHRLMDSIEPEILEAVEHAPHQVEGVLDVHEVRARWLGHRVHADLHITVDARLAVHQAHEIVEQVHHALQKHVPSFGGAQIHVCPDGDSLALATSISAEP